MTNIWRKTNRDKKLDSYHDYVDCIYTRKTLKAKTCNIIPTAISAHGSVAVKIEIKKTEPKDQGCWKLHTSILKHQNVIDILK